MWAQQMTRITRVFVKQGHPIPKTTGARGPFPPELYRSLPVVEEYQQISGNGGPEIPVEGTAQNNFRAYKWFKCNRCQALVHEPDLNTHQCMAVQSYPLEEE